MVDESDNFLVFVNSEKCWEKVVMSKQSLKLDNENGKKAM